MVLEGLARDWEVSCITRSPDKVLNSHQSAKRLSANLVDPLNSGTLRKTYQDADVVVFGLNIDCVDWDPFMVDTLAVTLEALAALERKPTLISPVMSMHLGARLAFLSGKM